jgi:general secretion pathway protein A
MSDVSDPHPKQWLADDPNFLASLNDLDRNLAGRGEAPDDDPAPGPPPAPPTRAAAPPPPPDAPRSSAEPARPGVARVTARAPAAAPVSAAPVPLSPPDIISRAGPDIAAHAPPLTFTRPSLAAEPRVRRPLLDLFPPSALEPERPPLELGTAVGPQLPPPRPRQRQRSQRPPDAAFPPDTPTYETFYGLREKPFSLSTDPRFQYQSASYERAGRELQAAIQKHGGPAVLTGRPGMGKTMLCRSLVQEIDRRTVTSLVLEPLLSIDELLKTLLVDFGVVSRDDLAAAPELTREMLTGTLTSFLASLVRLQASAVVLVDDAQNLPIPLLTALEAIIGGGGPEVRVLQLVLVGEPALTKRLKDPDLQLLNASVARRTELGPLAADEISGYVTHRLSIAGGDTRIEFDEPAITRLFEWSAGVPRVVNLLCDRAMTRGQEASAAVIDPALVDAAAADLDLDAPAGDAPGVWRSLLVIAAFAALVLVGAAGALWVSRDAVNRTIRQWENIPLAPGGPVRRLPLPITPIPPPSGIPDRPPVRPNS